MSEPTRDPADVAAQKETIIVSPAVFASENPGDRIGRYKLLQVIGEGGMGTVWMAEQEEPVRRRVALKVIKGMDTKQVIGRFEAERQALALMDHPNIAKVLDAGATDKGRPFFVMELVEGVSITRYCDEHKLSTEERLKMFIDVCRAIQHAHQKAIIHRDIKPSNILVAVNDGVPTPKVIDFGIAKATAGQPLTDKTVFTALMQFIGTPPYMSPEQANLDRLDIDTRSDIYSLGVLLYELLTGRTPFDPKRLGEAGLDEIRRIIREEEPPLPSTRLSTLKPEEQSTVAEQRQSDPPKLVGLIRGDLDWIVMKTLDKDRKHRYETPNELLKDVRCHIENKPVSVGPPSWTYRLGKFTRRHWRRQTRFSISVLVAGVVLPGSLLLVLFYTTVGGFDRLSSGYFLRGQFDHVTGLQRLAAVRKDGRKVGYVESMVLGTNIVVVTMKLRPLTTVPFDSVARIRTSTQGRAFISLEDGSKEARPVLPEEVIRGEWITPEIQCPKCNKSIRIPLDPGNADGFQVEVGEKRYDLGSSAQAGRGGNEP